METLDRAPSTRSVAASDHAQAVETVLLGRFIVVFDSVTAHELAMPVAEPIVLPCAHVGDPTLTVDDFASYPVGNRATLLYCAACLLDLSAGLLASGTNLLKNAIGRVTP